MFSANRPPAQLLSDMWSPKTKNCSVGSSVGGSLSFLVLLSLCYYCPLVPSLLAPNWPLCPATVCRSSRGSLLIDQTYRPSPSDRSLAGYFTARTSFCLAAFFTPYTRWSFYRSVPVSVSSCVSLVAFLDALWLPPGCILPVIWVTGSLLDRFQPPCCTPVFLPRWSGTGFLVAQLFRRPPGCRHPHFARFFARPVVPTLTTYGYLSVHQASAAHTASLCRSLAPCSAVASPAGRLLDSFWSRFFGYPRKVGGSQPFLTGTSLSWFSYILGTFTRLVSWVLGRGAPNNLRQAAEAEY